MADEEEQYWVALSSDAPATDPAQDAYGYAAFANSISKAVQTTPSPQGLVMAIHGPWGSGKSTLLNFVKHDLASLDSINSPIVIDFNPWWFNDREHLATQFLAQFKSKLPHESKALLAIGNLMAEYSGALSKAVALGTGIPWLDVPVNAVLKLLKIKAKDVPTVKAEISAALTKAGQRFLFVIDDLDRLTPDEIRELFKVIKALADFPNVIYLLSFDREVVSKALLQSLGVDGDAYLEKIVQAPFSLPAVNKLLLRKKLFADLDRLLEALPMLKFDSSYWGNVYFDGLDQFIEKPRDVVRIINALSVTYPAAAGEVNPIDYIAMEFLRVFEPTVYSTIRDNREMFVGAASGGHRDSNQPLRAFHETWLLKVQEHRRDSVKDLVSRLFPKADSIWGGMSYGSEWTSIWRKDLRVCSAEIFDIFFQFGISGDALSRAELDNLLAISADRSVLVGILKAAKGVTRPDGRSKARDYVDRLRDLKEELGPEVSSHLLAAFFEVGDDILTPADEGGGLMAFPNRWRVLGLVDHLLGRVPIEARPDLLRSLVSNGSALALMVNVVDYIDEALADPAKHSSSFAGFDAALADELKTVVLSRLEAAPFEDYLGMAEFGYVLVRWEKWGNPTVIKEKFAQQIQDDDVLPVFLEKFLRVGSAHGMGDRVSRETFHLNPKILEGIADIYELEPRVEAMLKKPNLTRYQRAAGECYVKGMGRIRKGQDPDGMHFDDL